MDIDLDELRPLLFSIAYRMTGSVGDAEDIVQEAVIRTYRALSQENVTSPKAFAATTTTRLAIDHLRSARVRRESYVGTWLPEPLVTDPAPGPAERAEMSDSLSLAFLVLLESLSPVERAVFVLREVFGFDYGEIAAAVGKPAPTIRQGAHPAREHVRARRKRGGASKISIDPERNAEITAQFLATAAGGDVEALMAMLAPDATWMADRGGRGAAARR